VKPFRISPPPAAPPYHRVDGLHLIYVLTPFSIKVETSSSCKCAHLGVSARCSADRIGSTSTALWNASAFGLWGYDNLTPLSLSLSLSISLLASCRMDLFVSMLRIPSVLLPSHGEERRGGVCEEGEATRGDSVSGYPSSISPIGYWCLSISLFLIFASVCREIKLPWCIYRLF
jgi:hypothetical protein